jgi:Outer membrane protein beta-barrel domain
MIFCFIIVIFKKHTVMKKVFVLLVFITGSLAGTAQIKKSAVLLGGQLGFNNSSSDYTSNTPPNTPQNQKNKGANFGIAIGSAIKDNVVVGINAGYGSFKNENTVGITTFTSTTDQYNFGIFYRQYKSLGRNFYFLGEAGVGYNGSKQTDKNTPVINDVTRKSSGVQLYLSPGVAYQVSKKLQLEILIPNIVSAGYSVNKTTSTGNNTKQDQFNINTNLSGSPLNSLAVGFRFIL